MYNYGIQLILKGAKERYRKAGDREHEIHWELRERNNAFFTVPH